MKAGQILIDTTSGSVSTGEINAIDIAQAAVMCEITLMQEYGLSMSEIHRLKLAATVKALQ